jgi:hypothetical protein
MGRTALPIHPPAAENAARVLDGDSPVCLGKDDDAHYRCQYDDNIEDKANQVATDSNLALTDYLPQSGDDTAENNNRDTVADTILSDKFT